MYISRRKPSSQFWNRRHRWSGPHPRFAAGRLHRQQKVALWGNSLPVSRPAGGATAADPILLYRNENPYGPSEKSSRRAARICRQRQSLPPHRIRHTHGQARRACTRLSANKSCLAVAPGKFCAWPRPLFSGQAKKTCARAHPRFPHSVNSRKALAAKSRDVPLNKRYEHDLSVMLDRAPLNFRARVYRESQQSHRHHHAAQKRSKHCSASCHRT